MALVLPNRVRFYTTTNGTGTITVGSAVSGFQTPASAGVAVGSTVGYCIEDGSNFEAGTGTYLTGGLVSRDIVESSSSGVGVKISLSGSAVAILTVTGGLLTPLWDNRGRNKFLNPVFRVQQRGAGSFSGGSVLTADRWVLLTGTDTTSLSLISLTDTHRTAIGDEEATYGAQLSVAGNSAAGAYTAFCQKAEDVRRFAGKTVILSFYALGPTGSFKVGASVDQNFGTSGSASVLGVGSSTTINTSFARYSIALAVPSIIGKTVGTAGDNTQFNLWFSSGSTNAARTGSVGVQTGTVTLWGMQLEVGGFATPLEKPEISLDWETCQRFYQANGQIWFSAYSGGSGQNMGTITTLPVRMRVPPTVAFASQTYTNCATLASSSVNEGSFIAYATASAAGNVVFSGSYSANAEL